MLQNWSILIWEGVLFVTSMMILISSIYFCYKYPKTRAHPGPVLLCIVTTSCLSNLTRVLLECNATSPATDTLLSFYEIANYELRSHDHLNHHNSTMIEPPLLSRNTTIGNYSNVSSFNYTRHLQNIEDTFNFNTTLTVYNDTSSSNNGYYSMKSVKSRATERSSADIAQSNDNANSLYAVDGGASNAALAGFDDSAKFAGNAGSVGIADFAASANSAALATSNIVDVTSTITTTTADSNTNGHTSRADSSSVLYSLRHLQSKFTNSTTTTTTSTPINANNSQVAPPSGIIISYNSILFWASIYFMTATTAWYLMLAMDLISSLSNPFLPFQANNILHHLHAWPSTLLFCLLLYFTLKNEQGAPSTHMRFYFIIAPMYFVLLYISIALWIAWQKSKRLETNAHLTTRRMAKLIVPYLIVYALMALSLGILYVVEIVHTEIQRQALLPTITILDQAIGTIEGIAVYIIYYFHDAQNYQCCVHWCHSARASKHSNTGLPRFHLGHRRSTANTSPISTNSEHSPHSENARNSRNSRLDPNHENTRNQFLSTTASPLPPTTTTATFAANNTTNTNTYNSLQDEIDVGSVLRENVMRYTKAGIIDSAKRAQGHRIPVVSKEDFSSIATSKILFQSELTFQDCAPVVFHHLREFFTIDAELYMESFAQHQVMKEIVSEGKSGNIFYFTANRRFLVKSVPKTEFDCLRKILPNYHQYVTTHPNTYLCRYYGCHSITLPVGSRKMYFIVMENQFQHGTMAQRFDLKGNTDRRQAIPAQDMEQNIHQARQKSPIPILMMDIDFLTIHQTIVIPDEMHQPIQLQLCHDVTFLQQNNLLDYSILVGMEYMDQVQQVNPPVLNYQTACQNLQNQKNQHNQQMMQQNQPQNRDAQSQNSIGPLCPQNNCQINPLPPPGCTSISSPLYPSHSKLPPRCILSRDHDKRYVIGIIDMLQTYSWKWSVQRWFLAIFLCKDYQNLSAVPPTKYGARLHEFIQYRMFNNVRKGSIFALSLANSSSDQQNQQNQNNNARPSGFAHLQTMSSNELSPTTQLWIGPQSSVFEPSLFVPSPRVSSFFI